MLKPRDKVALYRAKQALMLWFELEWQSAVGDVLMQAAIETVRHAMELELESIGEQISRLKNFKL